MEWLDIHKGAELVKLSTEQLDMLHILDLHSNLLGEDPENIPGILQNLSDEKFQALIDISVWNNDQFDVRKFSGWLNIILAMESAHFLDQLKRMDSSEICLVLFSIFEIKWYEQDVNYPDHAIITPDSSFVLIERTEIADDEFLSSFGPKLVNMIYAEDMAFGRKICLDSMSLVFSAVEESVFKQRSVRLSEEGIPTYIDALDLYHFEEPAKILKNILSKINKEENRKHSLYTDLIISSFTVAPRNFFRENLKISDERIADIQMELSALLTSSVVINNALNRDSKYIKEIIERSRAYLNLGIEFVAENTPHSLETVLTFVPLRSIFRLGFSLLVDLKRNANNTSTAVNAVAKPGLITVDEEEFLKNLMLTIPLFKDSLTKQPEIFSSLNTLKTARKMLADIASRVLVNVDCRV